MSKLSHLDEQGRARMVDVGDKPVTRRHAIAEGRVWISAALADAIASQSVKKGDLLAVARLAGIQAAKRTDELIPLCHSLPLEVCDVEAELACEDGRHYVALRAYCAVHGKTGIEMEAFTAVAVAALTVVDMGKAVDAAMVVDGIRLLDKAGGRRGLIRPQD